MKTYAAPQIVVHQAVVFETHKKFSGSKGPGKPPGKPPGTPGKGPKGPKWPF